MGKEQRGLNKVILIGGNHHNGLNLARSFGTNGIKPYGIIVDERGKNVYLKKSRYWKKTWVVSDNHEAIWLATELFKNESQKPVIIPYSDGAASEIDKNLSVLGNMFITPSLGNKEGAILGLMNKQRQVEFAQKYKIPTAKTWIVDVKRNVIPKEIVYPCIVKPVISFEGSKLDIAKCDDQGVLFNTVMELANKGYKRVLIQEFLEFEREFLLAGCCGTALAYFVSSNERSWPIVGGTGSFDRCTNSEKVLTVVERIVEALKEERFNGLFDIELFYVNNKIYLNEINWRNSGRDFMCFGTGVHYAVIWYYSVVGKDCSNLKHFCYDTNQYGMDEATDLRHVVYGGLSLKQWLFDKKKTQSFALWNRHDLIPVFLRYFELVIEMFKRGKKG